MFNFIKNLGCIGSLSYGGYRPLKFVCVPPGGSINDKNPSTFSIQSTRTIRDMIQRHKLSKFLYNVDTIRAVKWNRNSCFVFYRPDNWRNAFAFPLVRELPMYVNFNETFREVFILPPILALGFENEMELIHFHDKSHYHEKVELDALGIESAYVGNVLKL